MKTSTSQNEDLGQCTGKKGLIMRLGSATFADFLFMMMLLITLSVTKIRNHFIHNKLLTISTPPSIPLPLFPSSFALPTFSPLLLFPSSFFPFPYLLSPSPPSSSLLLPSFLFPTFSPSPLCPFLLPTPSMVYS